jgi:hypothetical protein
MCRKPTPIAAIAINIAAAPNVYKTFTKFFSPRLWLWFLDLLFEFDHFFFGSPPDDFGSCDSQLFSNPGQSLFPARWNLKRNEDHVFELFGAPHSHSVLLYK